MFKKLVTLYLLLPLCFAQKLSSIILVDGLTGDIIANTKILIKKINTIVCGSAPCHSNETRFPLITNDKGEILLNEKILSFEKSLLRIEIENYHSSEFKNIDQFEDKNIIEMVPLKITNEYKKITFVDQINGNKIANKRVWASEKNNCHINTCKDILESGMTNKFGHFYYPFPKVFKDGLSQIKPVWFYVEGYYPHERHHHHKSSVKMKKIFD